MTADDALLVAALDLIEQREARLLAWGLVGSFLTSGEVAEIVDGFLTIRSSLTRYMISP